MKASRKRSKDGSSEEKGVVRSVSSEALRGVCAIFFIAIAGFLILAELGGGGALGTTLHSWLSWLLGIGYILLPISLILVALLIFKSFERNLGWIQFASMAVFLLAGLGLIDVGFPGQGGVLGMGISNPILAGVDTVATVIFLIAFTIASLVVAFDIHLGILFGSIRDRLRAIRPEKGTSIEDNPIAELPEEEGPDGSGDEERELEVAAEKKEKGGAGSSIAKFFQSNDAPAEGFPIIAATGSAYIPPPLSILAKNKGKPEVGDVKANMNIIKRTLQNFGIQVEMDEVSIGPTVTRYSMKPAEGVRLSKIIALQSNLELALAASPVRIEAPIPGKSLVGIEVPNIARTTLGLAPLISDDAYVNSDKPLLMALGRSITGAPHFADLARMPHILVAGTTGAGKSVAIHDFVVSLLYRCGPERLRFIMVDPKRVELTVYNSIPHLLTPVVTDAKKAILALKWLAKEMERRYNILEAEAVRDISSYHQNVVAPALEKAARGDIGKPLPEAMPYIVLVIDELADIMSTYPRELEGGIVRLAQMSRAVGIHLILSTQRPSVKVITGLIKANIPARVALQVASQIDSRTILDTGGAEKLLGSGDMLFLSGEMSKPRRIQAPFISEEEVKKVVAHILRTSEGTLSSEIDLSDPRAVGGPDPIFSASLEDAGEDDEMYAEAKRTVIEAGKASTSYLQRKLSVGYARAAKLIDMLEERGIVGPADGAKPREIVGAGNADELVRGDMEEELPEEKLMPNKRVL
ncbi:MAG: DNA translocase FtsK [Patescibacteria group bacterium]